MSSSTPRFLDLADHYGLRRRACRTAPAQTESKAAQRHVFVLYCAQAVGGVLPKVLLAAFLGA